MVAETEERAGTRAQPRRIVTLVLAAAVVLLAVLVQAGRLEPLDRYAVHHLMPGLTPTGANRDRIVNRVADTLTIPARAGVATVLFACILLAARRRVPVVRWAVAFAAGAAAELLGKALVSRPLLHMVGGVPLTKFDASFPSGHALRAVLLAALVAAADPVPGVPAVLWAGAVVVLLVAAGTHTPSDVAGGAALGAALALACGRRDRTAT